jgi:arylsulfatase A-like enzyme
VTGGFRGVVGRTVRESTPWWPEPARPPAGAPNVVLIVLDDVGFADLGCFGSDVETPHIDALAARGLRYQNFHTTALCSPTRASLLTGRNHHSVGMAVVSNWDTGFPGARGRIAHSAATLGEILSASGYHTFAVGKWHLAPTDETSAVGPYDHWPCQRGFDRFYGFLDGATDHWCPDLVVDNHRVDPPRHEGYHLTEDLVDQAIGLVRDSRSVHPELPFLLYLCFGTAHYPVHVPRPYVEKYRGRYDRGWDVARDERLARQLAAGIVPPGTELAPRNEGVPAWDELSDDERTVAARLQEAYAGMLDHTDAQIGRLLQELDRLGARDDTLVVLMSDNGATLEGGRIGHLNYMRHINGLPFDLDDGLARLDEIGGPTTSPAYSMGWGMASNTPLKRYKQNTHGGGVRDPLIVAWPRGVTDPGSIRSHYHHVSDIVPTVLELAGIEPPAEVKGVAQQPIEGVSMAASIGSASAPGAKAVQYFEMLGNRGIWSGGWKAVAYHRPGTDFDDDRWELYHLDRDFSECHDLAGAEPARLRQMVELWWAEAGRYRVLPLDDRILERFHVPKPRPITDRTRFEYHPGAVIPSDGAPNIKDVSYTITADVDRLGDGTVVSCGDRFSGYALYVRDGHLVHDYNAAGAHHVVRSTIAVPTGPARLEYRFTRTGALCGTGELVIDGHVCGRVEIDRTLGVHDSPAGLTVGRTRLSAIAADYAAPFPFDGTIARVEFTLGGDRGAPAPLPLGAMD